MVRGRGDMVDGCRNYDHDICASMVTNGSTALIFMHWIQ